MFSTYCNAPSLTLSTLHILILLLLCNSSTRQAGQKLSFSCQCHTAAECRSPILHLVWSYSKVHVLLARDWTKLIFCCLLLKSQCLRGKCWWKKRYRRLIVIKRRTFFWCLHLENMKLDQQTMMCYEEKALWQPGAKYGLDREARERAFVLWSGWAVRHENIPAVGSACAKALWQSGELCVWGIERKLLEDSEWPPQ